jgi:biopolymer transport protein ExbB/TolQ
VFCLGPEVIIVGALFIIGTYIFIQMNINNKRIKGKSIAKKSDLKEKVELKTVVVPKITEEDLHKQMSQREMDLMKKAALESIEDERRWKESLKKEEQAKLDELKQKEQSELDKKLEELQDRLDEINFTIEEQNFIDEVNELSPQLKAVLFADLLNRKGY